MSSHASSPAAASEAEPPLTPMQISAQRLQSIGVQTGQVQRRSVNDRIFTTGNVAVDETRLAYVQLRFSGYLQKVFVDATYHRRAVHRADGDAGEVLQRAEIPQASNHVFRATELQESSADLVGTRTDVLDRGREWDVVLVRDLGTVAFGPDIRRGVAEWQGEGETVGGIVVMRYGMNALQVIDGVKRKIAEIGRSLPPGVEIRSGYERSGLIKASIHTLERHLIEEAIVVSAVILLFLWHFRSALIPILTIPIAVLASFIPMYYLHVSSNIMELTGIKTPVGMKIQEPSVEGIQQVGAQISQILSGQPDVQSVFAERVAQGFYVNVAVNRSVAARYGLDVGDVQRTVESGIGGQSIVETVLTRAGSSHAPTACCARDCLYQRATPTPGRANMSSSCTPRSALSSLCPSCSSNLPAPLLAFPLGRRSGAAVFSRTLCTRRRAALAVAPRIQLQYGGCGWLHRVVRHRGGDRRRHDGLPARGARSALGRESAADTRGHRGGDD
jgi:multidrug efflux pump subunit AcrB